MKSSKSLIVFILCSIFFLCSPFFTKRWNNPGSNAVISWDICGYWLYLPSFFYDDLGKLNKYDSIQYQYHPASDAKDMAFIHPATGKYVMNYPCGQAIMNIPAFAVGHIWAKYGGYKVDGFSYPYQIVLAFWCIIFACIGLWVLRKLLLRYFEDWLVAVLLATICLATNYYNFVAFSSVTHAYLFTLYAMLLLLTDTFYRNQKNELSFVAAIGVLSGLMTITRPTEIICVIIPLLWCVRNIDDLQERLMYFIRNKKVVLVYVLSAFISALPQLIYWKVYAGHWLFFSYHGDDKTFSFLHPHILNVLISYKKGWLVYTPVMILSLLGFYQLYKSYRQIFWPIAIFGLLNLYLVSSWDIWWYGGCFSMRALIQSYPLLVFPMGAFMQNIFGHKVSRYVLGVFLVFCLWLNMVMHYQANNGGIINGDNETKAYFWKTFGRMSIDNNDKKLLDTNEEMPEKMESSLHEMYHLDTNKTFIDSFVRFADRKCFMLGGDKQWTQRFVIPAPNTIHKGWYRVYATVFFPEKEWDVWSQTQFNTGFYNGDEIVKLKMIRIQRICEQGNWREEYVDIKVPHHEGYESFAVNFWNANSKKAIYITNIRVLYTDRE